MTPLEFLRSDAVLALLARAAVGAGVPLSVHFVERNQEGARIAGWGQCAACRHVQSLPGGAGACRLSRTTAASMALRQRRPMPFICHLGFACVSAPVLPGQSFVMTFGPFCPREEQRSLEADIRSGLTQLLDRDVDTLPVSLEDIHRAPSASVPAIAEWTMEALETAWALMASEDEAPRNLPAPTSEPTPAPSRRRSPHKSASVPGPIPAIVAALAGGSFPQARALLQGDLEEWRRSNGRNIAPRRARVAALVSAVLEGLAAAGVSVEAAQAGYPEFLSAVAAGSDDPDFLEAAMGFFAFLRRSSAREQTAATLSNYPELFALVNARLVEGITLEEVASALGETPSAISHRLKRKFGMSFSDYVGRIRVERAKRLFRETRLDVAEVGRRVGIEDPSNFARLFKKFEGTTPPAYRREFGKQ